MKKILMSDWDLFLFLYCGKYKFIQDDWFYTKFSILVFLLIGDGGWFVIFWVFKSILFLLIEFHCTFSISCIIISNYVCYVVFGLVYGRLLELFFVQALLLSLLMPLYLPSLSVSLSLFILVVPMCHVQVLGKYSFMSFSFPPKQWIIWNWVILNKFY